MKVLHVINSLMVGGAETLLVESLNHFVGRHPEDQHHLVSVFGGGPLSERFSGRRDRYLDLAASRRNPLPAVRKLRSYIVQHGVDVVHSHLYEATLFARVARPRGVRVVSTYHTGFHNPRSIEFSWKRRLLDQLTCHRTDLNVFVSEAVRDDIRLGVPIRDNFLVLKNFCAPEFRPLYVYKDEPSLRLVAVGNLREQKNHALALEALSALKDRPISLDIYGGGPLEQDLQGRIAQGQLRARIITGTRVTPELLAGYDAFVMTSRHEGMSLALIEAMRTGLPAILNDIPTLKETAADAGLYFRKDSAEHLRDLLVTCLADKAQLRTLSPRAVAYSEPYTIDRYVESLRAAYQRILGQTISAGGRPETVAAAHSRERM